MRGTSFLLSLDGDRHSMLIGSADIEDVLPFHPEISDINICRDIHTGEVADMVAMQNEMEAAAPEHISPDRKSIN